MIVVIQHARVPGALAAALLLGACVATPEFEEVRTMAQQAENRAAEAQEAAQRAQSSADEAQATADAAMKAARQASRCCSDINEKIDRMFKKSMYK